MKYICENMKTYQMSSIIESDLDELHRWYNLQMILSSREAKILNKEELRDCINGYMLWEEEFFVKIKRCEKIVGIIKGKVECGDESRMWINDMIFEWELTSGEAESIIEEFISAMKDNHGIKKCYAGVIKIGGVEEEILSGCGFEQIRTVLNYFNEEGKKTSGEVMFRIC